MSRRLKLYAGLIVLSLFWGSNFLFTTILLDDFKVWFIVFLRCVIGMIGLFVVLILLKEKIRVELKHLILLILAALIGGVLPWSMMTYSQKYLTSYQGGILNATSPMWFLLITFIFYKRKINVYQFIGLLVGFIGLLFLFNDFTHNFNLLSIILALGAALLYSLTLIITNQYMKQINSLVISLYTLLFTAFICGIISFIFETNNFLLIFEVENAISFFILGFFSSGVGYALFFYLAKASDDGLASYVTYFIPIVALILGVLILKEEITLKSIIGIVIVIFSIMLTEKSSSK